MKSGSLPKINIKIIYYRVSGLKYCTDNLHGNIFIYLDIPEIKTQQYLIAIA